MTDSTDPYHIALHALKLAHDKELSALQRAMPINYIVLEAGLKARLKQKIDRLNAEYGRETK